MTKFGEWVDYYTRELQLEQQARALRDRKDADFYIPDCCIGCGAMDYEVARRIFDNENRKG